MNWTIEEIKKAEAEREALRSAHSAKKEMEQALEDKKFLPTGSKERRQVLSEKRKAEASIKKLREALKDAPPSPVSPQEAKEILANTLCDIRKGYEERLTLFLKDVEQSPKYAIVWGAEVVGAQTRWEVVEPVLAEIEREGSTLDSIREAYTDRKTWARNAFF